MTLCWDGDLTKIGPTIFTFDAEDFVPDQNLSMAVVSPVPIDP